MGKEDYGTATVNGKKQKVVAYVGIECENSTITIVELDDHNFIVIKADNNDSAEDSILLSQDELHALGFTVSSRSKLADGHKGLDDWMDRIQKDKIDVQFFKSSNYAKN